jgi:N-acetyl-anhydromuramyl-L-alanine amidase AmpD
LPVLREPARAPMTAHVPPALLAAPTKFIQARNYTPAQRRKISVVVMHSAEAPEKPGKAADVANWFAGDQAPKASAHYVVDAGEVVQCVREQDVAWAAPGANSQGIQIELVGYARQTAEDWADTYSAAMLEKASRLVAVICVRYGIPVMALDALALFKGQSGITTHAAVTEAFGRSTHTDPGKGFPMAAFVSRVAEIQREGRA